MGFRIEKDFLGEKQIPDDAYYGIQTLRGKENFHITGMPVSREPYFVKAFGYVKKAAAMANRDLGVLDAKVADAIIRACDRLIAGELLDQFVTDFIQGGAGTSTNMNANEVIANLALESLGHKKGEYQYVNPERPRELRAVDERRLSDGLPPRPDPAAGELHGGAAPAAGRLLRQGLGSSTGSSRWAAPTCRTRSRCRSAPSSGAGGRRSARRSSRIAEVRQILHGVNLGATAIGTTVTAAPGYPELATKHLADITGIKFTLAEDLIEATSDTGRLRAAVRRAEAHLDQAHQDLQRPPDARLGAALRIQRDQPAADAAGLLDHAGQGQPRDPGSRQPDQLPRDRARPDGDPRGLRRAAAAERHGAGDHLRALRLDHGDGARRQQPAGELRARASPRTPSAHATWCSIRWAS